MVFSWNCYVIRLKIFTIRVLLLFLHKMHVKRKKKSMVNDISYNRISFIDNIEDYASNSYPPHVLHVLCLSGSLSFNYRNTRYLVVAKDVVILPEPQLATLFTHSQDFHGLLMVLTHNYTSSLNMHSNYGVIGTLNLMLNPVMKLSDIDFDHCREAMIHMRHRLQDEHNEFWEEMISHLLMAHILDLYDISARQHKHIDSSDRKTKLLVDFFTMLYKGSYIDYRNLAYYADKLCITPHYLTDICRQITGHPATHWIDHFTTDEIVRRLSDKHIPLSEIAEDLHFSSLSHFSRFVLAHLGVSPSQYRQRFWE